MLTGVTHPKSNPTRTSLTWRQEGMVTILCTNKYYYCLAKQFVVYFLLFKAFLWSRSLTIISFFSVSVDGFFQCF